MLDETTSTFATTIGNSIGIIGCVNWKKKSHPCCIALWRCKSLLRFVPSSVTFSLEIQN